MIIDLSSLILLIEVIILQIILNENNYKNAITIKTTQQTMNAKDESLSTVADFLATKTFEINKEDFHKQKQTKQTQLKPIRQMTTLHLKQQELDSGFSDTKSESSESSYNSTYDRKTLKRPYTSVPSDFTFNREQLLQDGQSGSYKDLVLN